MEEDDKDIKYLKWALEGAGIFSTCGKRQHMAIILDEMGFVAGVGYNGVPSGFTHCIDGGCPRLSANSEPGSSYEDCLAIHAEQNAIMNATSRVSRLYGTMYVTGEPCFTCAKLICNSGVYRVVIAKDSDYEYIDFKKVQKLFEEADIELAVYKKEDI